MAAEKSRLLGDSTGGRMEILVSGRRRPVLAVAGWLELPAWTFLNLNDNLNQQVTQT